MSHWWSMVICDWVPFCVLEPHRRAAVLKGGFFPHRWQFHRSRTWNMVFLTNFLGVLKLCWFQFHLLLYRLAPLCPTYFPMQTVGISRPSLACKICYAHQQTVVWRPLRSCRWTLGSPDVDMWQGLLALGILRSYALPRRISIHHRPQRKIEPQGVIYAWFQSRCSVRQATPMHMLLLVPPRKQTRQQNSRKCQTDQVTILWWIDELGDEIRSWDIRAGLKKESW